MTSQPHSLVELFAALLALDPAERARRLDEIREGQPKLAADLAGMLDADADPDSFFERAAERARDAVDGRVCDDSAPRSFANGRYEISRELGRGALSVVYLAHDRQLDRDVAVKCINLDGANSRTALRLLESEGPVTASFSHRGVLAVHEQGRTEDGRLFIVTEYVDGQTLSQYLRDQPAGRRGARALVRIFERICEITAHAHARGVVHRDLKPSNIMLRRHDQRSSAAPEDVVILDWGIAKVLQGSTMPDAPAGPGVATGTTAAKRSTGTATTTQLGTPGYMAPEQARGDHELVDARSDVFALGSILCEMLTGEPAFVGSPSDRIAATLAATPDATTERLRTSRAPRYLVRLAKKCLSRDVDKRPADATAVMNDIRRHHWFVRTARVAGAGVAATGLLVLAATPRHTSASARQNLGAYHEQLIDILAGRENASAVEWDMRLPPDRLEAADRLLIQLERIAPDDVATRIWRIRWMRYGGRIDDAYDMAQLLLQEHPESPGARTEIGMALWELGDRAAAVAVLSDAITLFRNALKSKSGMLKGELLARRLSIERALSEALTLRGNCYEELGQLDLALDDYRSAIELEPLCAGCRSNLAVVLFGLGRTGEAVIEWQRAYELDPTGPQIPINLACAHLHVVDSTEGQQRAAAMVCAEHWFDTARSANPSHMHLPQLLAAILDRQQ